MIVGATLLPMPREAAIVQSINALMVYEQPMILMRSMLAVMPSGSLAKKRKELPSERQQQSTQNSARDK